jgi:hypothetical protein
MIIGGQVDFTLPSLFFNSGSIKTADESYYHPIQRVRIDIQRVGELET